MMFNKAQLRDFGFFYSQEITAVMPSTDPSGTFNPVRYFIEKREDCFDTLALSLVEKKKTLIIGHFLFKSLWFSTHKNDIYRIIETLISDYGFECYVSMTSGLKRINPTQNEFFELEHLVIRRREDLASLLPEHQLGVDECLFLDAETLSALLLASGLDVIEFARDDKPLIEEWIETQERIYLDPEDPLVALEPLAPYVAGLSIDPRDYSRNQAFILPPSIEYLSIELLDYQYLERISGPNLRTLQITIHPPKGKQSPQNCIQSLKRFAGIETLILRFEFDYKINSSFLNELILALPHLTSLTVKRGILDLSENNSKSLQLDQIRRLNLSACIPTSSLAPLIRTFPALESLSLSFDSLTKVQQAPQRILDQLDFFSLIASQDYRMPHLQYCSLKGSFGLEFAEVLLSNTPNLQMLILDFQHLTSSAFHNELKSLPHLNSLTVYLNHENLSEGALAEDEAVKVLLDACPNLERLRIKNGIVAMDCLTRYPLKNLARKIPSIKTLDLSLHFDWVDDSFDRVPSTIEALTLKDTTLQAILSHATCPFTALKNLSIDCTSSTKSLDLNPMTPLFPNVEKLVIDDSYFGSFNLAFALPGLKILDLSVNELSPSLLIQLLNANPNLEQVTVSCEYFELDMNDEVPPSLLPLANLLYFRLIVREQDDFESPQDFFSQLFNNAPHLIDIDLIGIKLSSIFNLELLPDSCQALENITIETWGKGKLPSHFLQQFLVKLPRLKTLICKTDTRQKFIFPDSHRLPQGFALEHLECNSSFTLQSLYGTFGFAPGGKFPCQVSLPLTSEIYKEWHQDNSQKPVVLSNYNSSEPHEPDENTLSKFLCFDEDGSRIDYGLVISRYETINGAVSPANFHLTQYCWENDQLVPFNPDLGTDSEPVIPELIFDHQSDLKSYLMSIGDPQLVYGRIALDEMETGKDYLWQGCSPNDLPLALVKTDCVSLRQKNIGETRLIFLRIERTPQPNEKLHVLFSYFPHKLIPDLSPYPPHELELWMSLIASCSFNEQGLLIPNEGYNFLQRLQEQGHHHFIWELLYHYCSFEILNPDQDIVSENFYEIANELIKLRAGSCRHRAMLYSKFLYALGYITYYVTNEVHAFCTIQLQGIAYTVDLGGAPATMKIVLEADEIEDIEPIIQAEPEVITPCFNAENNPFQTWVHFPLDNFGALIDSSIARWLIKVDTRLRVQILLKQFANLDSIFVATSLDDFSLKSCVITKQGVIEQEGAILRFLNLARNNPHQTYYLFLPWIDVNSHQVAFNSLFDDKDRHLSGYPVPANVLIRVVTDELTSHQFEDDFYSRFDLISQCTKIPEEENLKLLTSTSISEDDAILSPAQFWQQELFMRYQLTGYALSIIPGKLTEALLQGRSGLKIFVSNNFSEQDRLRIMTLLKRGFIEFNGEKVVIPSAFTCEFYNLPTALSPYPISKQGKNRTFLLNKARLRLCFDNQAMSSLQNFFIHKGILAESALCHFYVTESLEDVDWIRIYQEAAKLGVDFTIQTLPTCKLPKAMAPWYKGEFSFKPDNKIQWVVTQNERLLFQEYPEAAIINLTASTQFSSLFYKLKRGKNGAIITETDLLIALRKGQQIIFHGEFSKALIGQLATIFCDSPYFDTGSEQFPVKGSILLVTQTRQTFSIFNLIPQDHLAQPSQVVVTPKTRTTPTSAETLASYLDTNRLVILEGDTGAGKTYLVEHDLRTYYRQQGLEAEFFYGTNEKEKWALSSAQVPLWIFDEANLDITPSSYDFLHSFAQNRDCFWMDAMSYPYQGNKIIFIRNPDHFTGRVESRFLNQYPYCLQFQPKTIALILQPLLAMFSLDLQQDLLTIIEQGMQLAKNSGLYFSPRNAQGYLLQLYSLSLQSEFLAFPKRQLLHCILLQDLANQGIAMVKESNPAFSQQTQDDEPQRKRVCHNYPMLFAETLQNKKRELQQLLQRTTTFTWTDSRLEAAFQIKQFLDIRALKLKGEVSQLAGINGVVIEGLPGIGKSQLIRSVLNALKIPYLVASPSSLTEFYILACRAAQEQKLLIMDELNVYASEKLMNNLLSGYLEIDGQRLEMPAGFFFMGSQNPSSYGHRKSQSKAQKNRLHWIKLEEYSDPELLKILTEQYRLDTSTATDYIQEYHAARDYAKKHHLKPLPNFRDLQSRLTRCSI